MGNHYHLFLETPKANISQIMQNVNKKEEELLRKGKGKRERQAAIYVSKIMSNAKNTEIGRYFGIQGSTVSEALKRVETRIKREGKFRKELEVLKKQFVIE
ncbi:MAG: hypothetical protein L6Q53_13845 [Candidatus Brocadia sinica]|nr:hypothetical protein [Candidatus Brocadia sinica]